MVPAIRIGFALRPRLSWDPPAAAAMVAGRQSLTAAPAVGSRGTAALWPHCLGGWIGAQECGTHRLVPNVSLQSEWLLTIPSIPSQYPLNPNSAATAVRMKTQRLRPPRPCYFCLFSRLRAPALSYSPIALFPSFTFAIASPSIGSVNKSFSARKALLTFFPQVKCCPRSLHSSGFLWEASPDKKKSI